MRFPLTSWVVQSHHRPMLAPRLQCNDQMFAIEWNSHKATPLASLESQHCMGMGLPIALMVSLLPVFIYPGS